MATGKLSLNANIAGVSIAGTIEKTGSGQISEETLLTAGQPGSLTTRSGNDSGEITMTNAQHGVTTGEVVDLYWTNADGTPGKRVGVTVGTVNGTAVPITTSGAGDNLPAQGFAVVVGQRSIINADFVGNEMLMLAVSPGAQRSIVDFQDGDDLSLFTLDIPAGASYAWSSGGAETNPVAGDTVARIVASSGSTSADTLKIGVIKESVS